MSAWVDGITELAGVGHTGIELSLSHLKMLVPEGGFCCLAAAVIAFCLVAAWQDARFNKVRKGRSDSHDE